MKGIFTRRNLAVFVLGIFSFASVIYVQIPIQSVIINNPTLKLTLSTRALILILAMVAGFVQEIFKALPPFLGEERVLGGIISGLAFGITEASFLLLPAIWQYGIGALPAISYVERLIAIVFHIATTGLIMYGSKKKRFLISYIVISLIHGFVDTLAGLTQSNMFSVMGVELAAGLVSVILLGLFVYLIKKDKTQVQLS
ncbi:MAG: hypothetical protein AUJ99_05960 [Caldisericum sp. CG2_30_36_11]|nr:YhfC family intramembrane metalloprotease [Caldisericota bacterium]NCQ53307.1 YhfC family intramembrane metalloprotease [Caldisericota bacterium]OIP12039.1 MAG: hypothetical protein AUJ99_05960 [Caldisericum sp. CG2_30_36_11]PIP49947.1 MAG: hypothetical protein COX13_01115 [Caldiserica bacterium CG23_combo_of_CG06-09_8_20_14_all_35_60]PIX29806.1 MAG: hypothetical protein COZ65_00415 [Caldiserica bacterium CG_4_8_14_3_um_filter_35_18]